MGGEAREGGKITEKGLSLELANVPVWWWHDDTRDYSPMFATKMYRLTEYLCTLGAW